MNNTNIFWKRYTRLGKQIKVRFKHVVLLSEVIVKDEFFISISPPLIAQLISFR
jgi:hypothetical protein